MNSLLCLAPKARRFNAQLNTRIANMKVLVVDIGGTSTCGPAGGIDAETAPLTVAAGANILVAGTSIFGNRQGIAGAMKRLQAVANNSLSTKENIRSQ